ncbi:hypothetical protein MNBD_CPR01-233 [hydrothermal vent metagenome]|uniref:Uncharacterized protein n=1 Tax=hydrothermal vent metagenome TaxID=652676 RepID=A0A3B0UM96_9ZZZZ
MSKLLNSSNEQPRKKVDQKKNTKMTSTSPMYIYATEMVSNYYSTLHLDKNTVLTISGSGDQVLNAYFFGAEDVVSFDLNKYSFFITNLKFTAVKVLSYTEFLNFFGSKHNDANFDYDLYQKIRPGINKRTKDFFDSIYEENLYSGSTIIKSEKYFRQRGHLSLKSADAINIYLKNEKNYLILRNSIKNKKLTFIQSDIIGISKKIRFSKRKFDLINISNVINYLSASVKSNDPEGYIINILIELGNILNKNGKIIFYAYSVTTYSSSIHKDVAPSSRKSFINRIKKETDFIVEEKKISGIRNKTMDKIIILKKD